MPLHPPTRKFTDAKIERFVQDIVGCAEEFDGGKIDAERYCRELIRYIQTTKAKRGLREVVLRHGVEETMTLLRARAEDGQILIFDASVEWFIEDAVMRIWRAALSRRAEPDK